MLGRSGYHLRRALRNMRQSPVLSLASVATVAVSLALLAFFTLAVLNVQQLTAAWGEEMAIVAYLDAPPEDKVLQAWIDEIRAYPEVVGVTFISKQDAYERFKRRLGEEADLLEGLEPEILPASLEIQLQEDQRRREVVEQVVERLRRDARFSDLDYGSDWLDKFEAFLLFLRVAGAALGSFLVFAALVIVANTIKLTLYARQDELEAMTMVGATPLFIKAPYLVEGALQGLFGGLAALVITWLSFRLMLMDMLAQLLMISGIDTIHFLPPAWQGAVVLGGGLVGLAGSLFALRKFVRIGPV
ncbi:MAG TPA: permease-like cell division protein FtsX [Desulfuromonadales bacterium]|nr:permease-like cell division protein FtsX [Desulfuromonadales bacterium]